jgi:glyoxylate carboligase
MINVEMAMGIRAAQKQFWKNWKKIQAATDAANEQNENNYSWQHYAGLEGVGNPSIYPEVTNYIIAKNIIEGFELPEEISFILNY